jgi:RNA polymerase sigma-70 factor (ECF subfamily)
MNQEELVKRLQIKDIMAFERLYNMYWENICGVINTIVRDNSLAQEISQDVFAKVWHNAHHYSPSKGRFFSWILNMARNAAIDELGSKSGQNNKKYLSADYFLDILKGTAGASQLSDVTGLKKLAKNVEKKNIEIFDLLYFKGYSHRETSEELGIPLKNLKKRNRNCIFQIRENMTFEWM